MNKFFTGEKGAVAIIVAMFIVVFALITAMVVDVGSLFQDRRWLQTVADSAALAGAQELPEDRDEAITVALEYATSNYPGTFDIDVTIGDYYVSNDMITVTLVNPDAPLFFGRVTEGETTTVPANATAIVAKPEGVGNVVPWSLDKEYFDSWVPGGEYGLKFPPTPLEPGNFMAVDLDNFEGGGSSDYTDRIINGYDELLYVGDEILTEPGNMAPTVSATNSRVDAPIGDGWDDFFDLTVASAGGYDLVGADSQFVVIPIISMEGVLGTQHVIIEGFATLIVSRIDGPNPGQSEIVATFVNRALIISEGAAIGAVGSEGLRVIRLIK